VKFVFALDHENGLVKDGARTRFSAVRSVIVVCCSLPESGFIADFAYLCLTRSAFTEVLLRLSNLAAKPPSEVEFVYGL
jgi:hypothetical protein